MTVTQEIKSRIDLVDVVQDAGVSLRKSGRNWAGYGRHVALQNVDDTTKALLTDPQTSGGLLVACAPNAAEGVLEIFRAEGFAQAAVIGELVRGSGIAVEG